MEEGRRWSKQEEEGVVEIRVANGVQHRHWWWYGASAAQLGLGIRAVRIGLRGDSNFMPLKAFSVASLFVGAAASAFFGTLRASGIHKVEDMKELGSNIRTAIGAPPRKRSE
ncbi:hypothetical protein KSS87_001578 [Heliosperma pusillum]|nr:hypothetical protein KSS87_001578 [Heliosperma pusillum]